MTVGGAKYLALMSLCVQLSKSSFDTSTTKAEKMLTQSIPHYEVPRLSPILIEGRVRGDCPPVVPADDMFVVSHRARRKEADRDGKEQEEPEFRHSYFPFLSPPLFKFLVWEDGEKDQERCKKKTKKKNKLLHK